MTYFEMPRRLDSAGRAVSGGRTSVGRRLERIEMKALVVLTYPLFLAVAVASRLGLRRPRYGAVVKGPSVSIFTEARQTAEATIPSAFRG